MLQHPELVKGLKQQYKLKTNTMKKILFLTIAALAIIGCSKDEDSKITLSTDNVVLYTEGTEQISANEEPTWKSDNKFVATVSNTGVIKGEHVGKATIIAIGKKGDASCRVEVKAKYNTYTEPVLIFGANKSTIKAKEKRTLDTEKEGSLLFKPDKSTIKGVTYIFENNKMTAAGVFVNTFSALETTDFLIERYLVVGAGSGDIVGLMLNDLPNKATMSIAMSIESGYVLVIYMPYEKNKSRGISKEDITKTKMMELFANK